MSSSKPSSDLATGKKFLRKLLYVQHVDEEKDMVSETPDRYVEEFNSESQPFKINGEIGTVWIADIRVYSNPLPVPLESNATIHVFVVFKTENTSNGFSRTWWSLEKNETYIIFTAIVQQR